MSEPRARIAVVTFPGSNDDADARLALERLGAEAVPVWYAANRLPKTSVASSSPAASRTATTCAAAPSPVSPP